MNYELRLPDLDLGDVPLSASNWLVEVGTRVARGDRLLEVLADGVTVDIPSPVAGIVIELSVDEDAPLESGQLLAKITPSTTAE